ncbi:hypothetical protein NC796_07545 [Aliifodinibius sp. S!AR15-10]|uniref:hypothetical protein n=1 Tax=Aliifodinibius sp. S!AR15-10 TaxID=2950437 RepID=UPI00285D7009|nr:hypothetical protein [Aliifodinibius sp. S!AR15-10]MDR8390986.1 hypothetical protein [Aliifodinibius sp. S!AR15-10]
MNINKIESVKDDYNTSIGKLAIEICEKHPMFWAQDEEFCRKDIERLIDKIKKAKQE